MTRNLKALGLALVAVFAMSAVVASAASAQNGMLTTDEDEKGNRGPVTLTGFNTGAEAENSLTAFGNSVRCPNALYTGHKFNTTPKALIPSGAEKFTITPHYGTCKGPLNLPAEVDMNGCDYNFHLGETVGTDEYALGATVVCPENQHIVVTVFSSTHNEETKNHFCTQTITEDPEKEYEGLTATDTTDGTVDVTGTIEGIVVDSVGTFPCPNGEKEDGVLHIDVTMVGHDEASEPTNIGISHE